MDKNVQELKQKVMVLISRNHGGNYQRMFNHYASKRLGYAMLDADELEVL